MARSAWRRRGRLGQSVRPSVCPSVCRFGYQQPRDGTVLNSRGGGASPVALPPPHSRDSATTTTAATSSTMVELLHKNIHTQTDVRAKVHKHLSGVVKTSTTNRIYSIASSRSLSDSFGYASRRSLTHALRSAAASTSALAIPLWDRSARLGLSCLRLLLASSASNEPPPPQPLSLSSVSS